MAGTASGWSDAGQEAAGGTPGNADPLPPLQGHEGVEVYSFPFPDDNIIGRYVDGLLASRRDWLQVVLTRSLVYRGAIEQELEQRGLPRELVFLPAVESGFEPRATSPRGAAGLWQLMRNTAQPYGLRMDQWVDQRRDFYLATEASLSKLAENYRIFGDWHLALAAYNAGVGKLSGIMKKSPGSDYWTLRSRGLLPRETAAFVPQFLALVKILSHPGRYGLDAPWDPAPTWERIPLASSVDLRVLSRASGVPLNVLTSSNPDLNFPITPPASYHYELKVPAVYAEAVREAISSAAMPLLEFRVHVVVPGDTLSELAVRYGVTVDIIQEFNPRVTPRTLQIGAKLLVPVGPVRRGG
jgi:membrane-bound lytic murein transglycosylase D